MWECHGMRGEKGPGILTMSSPWMSLIGKTYLKPALFEYPRNYGEPSGAISTPRTEPPLYLMTGTG